MLNINRYIFFQHEEHIKTPAMAHVLKTSDLLGYKNAAIICNFAYKPIYVR